MTIVKEALRNIWRRKARSALTIFGVAIGIFAFTTLGALAANFNKSIQTSFDYYTSRIIVSAAGGGSAGNAGLFAQGGQLPASLAERIKVIDGVDRAYPTITLSVDDSQLATFDQPALIYGFNPSDTEGDPKQLTIKEGRNLQPGDTGKTVIGSTVVQKKKAKIGDSLTLKGKNFEVVGILGRTGGTPDSFYEITLPEAQALSKETNIFNTQTGDFVTDVNVIPKEGVNADTLAKTINDKIRGVQAIPPNELKKQIEQASQIFQLIILGSALIAVVVGSLSVINTMVMSIAERQKEIGIKRVVGAKPRHILRETLLETGIMGLIGGLLGFALGAAVTSIINHFTNKNGLEIFSLTSDLAIASIGGAVALGIVAGVYPAWRATRIKPIEVLRNE